MEERDLEKALEIMAKLMAGEELGGSKRQHLSLYEEYISNSGVYDCVQLIAKQLHLSLYEYKDGLYMTAGEKNRVFGYSNEELKKAIGIRLNKELYLCYFIIYNIISLFYKDSAGYTFTEYVKIEDIIHAVDEALQGVLRNMDILSLNEVEENSFRQLALLWEALPVATLEDTALRAARNSKAGYVKLVCNFLLSQQLLLEQEERYYTRERMRALIEDYFEEYQGRLQELLSADDVMMNAKNICSSDAENMEDEQNEESLEKEETDDAIHKPHSGQ